MPKLFDMTLSLGHSMPKLFDVAARCTTDDIDDLSMHVGSYI